MTPGSSRKHGTGVAHTNIHARIALGAPMGQAAPNASAETPASLACIYGLTTVTPGCPRTLTAVATGGSRAIAVVDAFHYPTAAKDLAVFSAQFGLPVPNLKVIYASGTKPQQDPTGGWEVEAALDIEMAHALAPNAQIILVEAASANTSDLLTAEAAALKAVAKAGGGEVSNSWGGSEWGGETGLQSSFARAGVVVFASSGDTSGVEFPSALPNVVGVGGTTVKRDGTGAYTGQVSWGSSGGGLSHYVARPSFQTGVSGVVHARRGIPDIALEGDPNSGVWVYDSTPYDGSVLHWSVWGGTSVASPLAAALVNSAGSFAASTAAELAAIYANSANAADFTDITSGPCGNAVSGTASAGYDVCTGVGAPIGTAGK